MRTNEGFPADLPKIVEALARVLLEEGKRELGLMLKDASMRVQQTSFDNWDGGTYGYTLELQVPARRFAALGFNVEGIEEDIKKRIAPLTRLYPNHHVEALVIVPNLSGESDGDSVAATSPPTFWIDGLFRLFLSHVSAVRVETGQLARSLAEFGVSAFVAHEQIEPTKEWEEEIRLALTTCDALAALLSDGFAASKWTDQEVGFAIGRGILVLPVRMGLDPYGFLARYQGYQARAQKPSEIAAGIVSILAKHELTRIKMAAALVSSFEGSESFAVAKKRVANLELVQHWTPELADRVKEATSENVQISEAFGVPEKAMRIVRMHSTSGA